MAITCTSATAQFTTTVSRDGYCAPYTKLVGDLSSKYSEHKVAEGTAGPTAIILLADPDGDSFSVIVRHPDGMGCIVAAGKNMSFFAPPEKGDDL